MDELTLVIGRELSFKPNIAVPKLSYKEPIDDAQRKINKLMGVSDEDFLKYNPLGSDSADQTDDAVRKINKLMGVSDEDFLKYNPLGSDGTGQIDDVQRKINKLMGVSEEDILKYGADLT